MRTLMIQASLFCLAWLTSSSAFRVPDHNFDLYRRIPRSSSAPDGLPPRTHPHSTLAKRAPSPWFSLGLPGWTASVELHEPVAPSFWAAGAIANLYNKAIADCANFIALSTAPLAHGGTFRIGEIELAFEGNAPVPWELIKSLLGVVYEWANRGHVSTYTLWITNHTQVFRFILRVGPGSPWGPRGPPP